MKISKELEPLAEEARKYKSTEEFIKKAVEPLGEPIRPIKKGRVGEYVRIQSKWAGHKTPREFNLGVPKIGEIIKINPISVSIKTNDGMIYKFPPEAKISVDLTPFKMKSKEYFIDLYNQATKGIKEAKSK